jgi:hypothetical protein
MAATASPQKISPRQLKKSWEACMEFILNENETEQNSFEWDFFMRRRISVVRWAAAGL